MTLASSFKRDLKADGEAAHNGRRAARSVSNQAADQVKLEDAQDKRQQQQHQVQVNRQVNLDGKQRYSGIGLLENSSSESIDSHKRIEHKRPAIIGLLWRFGKRAMQLLALVILLDIVVLYWPMEEPDIEPRVAPHRPRPKFEGALQVNELLEQSERLFAGQFHAPEAMAWRQDKRAFYTGVEGGFILLVEPYEERWRVAARLNARGSVRDVSAGVGFGQAPESVSEGGVPFCERDVQLYGARAEFEPRLVALSRCSRPLGLRLSPDESRLYVSDPLSGLYRVDVANASAFGRHAVSKLVDFGQFQRLGVFDEAASQRRVLFADDIAVQWAERPDADLIYLTDCSRRWSLRYLMRLMLENDDSGRVLLFGLGERRLRPLGAVTPARMPDGSADARNLSFPNGLELTANGSALLISDLNNRRILMHHLRGPLAGHTHHLLWVPGYPDNVRRGLDSADGQPSYWAACGCAVSDGRLEMAEFFNQFPRLRKVLLKMFHFLGQALQSAGALINSTYLLDAGLLIKSIWLKLDPYCSHGLVMQFNEQGQVLRSLHAPHFGSHWRLLSEAHEVPLLTSNTNSSALYLGSVYYPYLGRVELLRELDR